MVNKRVYNYLIKYSKQYSLNDLRKKLVNSGYDRNVIDEAINALKQQTPGKSKVVATKNAPMKKTAKKSVPVSSKTKAKVSSKKQVKPSRSIVKEVVKPKRSKVWIWILIILFLLIVAGVGYYFFLMKLK